MELRHSFTVPTAADDAWSLFMDLERVGSCFPGATVTDVTDDGFTGTVKVKLGPIQLLYAGSGAFVEKDDAARRAVIEAKGKDKRGNGTAGATVTIELEPDGDGTRADVVTDLSVTGKPAQFGRGVMQDVSDKLLGQFVACIERQLSTVPPVPEATVQDRGEAGSRPAAVTEPVPSPPAEEQVAQSPAVATPAMVAGGPGEAVTSGGAATAGGAGTGSAAYGMHEAHRHRAPRVVGSDVEQDDALDLGSAVMPVLIQRYAGFATAGLIGFILGWLIGRRRT
jgi:carbon monoxide dehydrogenase subunit G